MHRKEKILKFLNAKYFDHGVLMVAMVKAGVELAFDTMVETGIYEESAYCRNHYTSYH